MRSKASWLKASLCTALLLAACEYEPRDFRHEFYAFGTIVSISLYDVTAAQNDAVMAELEPLYLRLSTDWYPWSPGELRALNEGLQRGESIMVSDELANLIRIASHYEIESGGRFSAALGRLSELWGLQPEPIDRDAPPDGQTIGAIVSSKPLALGLEWSGNTVSTANPHMMLDLGGIAKGYVLGMSTKILERHGLSSAIVNIGGDLFVLGTINDRDASIGIRSPFDSTAVAGLLVRDREAVVTSGNYERFVEIDGKRYTHIFDPRTGYPVEHTASVTVVDADPALADAAATALLVGGAREFDEIVASMHLTYAVLIDAQGDTRLTPAMAERLHWIDPPER